ncbi:hypothetical protein DFR71_1525 [Nocardia alba]|uniref:Uncharacterized protein n=2 Tax=Nocardia alba TaxID=225051 RepID=A0A4R1G2H7_9NOCA|nr:hypothetical protein DFR71_1525 [Nocardia alba]
MPHIFVGGDSFSPSAMTKNGNVVTGAPNVWTVVGGWTADTVGYPGSVVSGNGLQAQGGAAAAPLIANVVFSGAGMVGTFQARLLVGTTVVATSAAISGMSGTLVVNTTAPIAAGEVVTIELTHTVSSSLWYATITGGAVTFLRIG